jgi:NAD(P)-dependent dehydrogenase (short-subunit alcohol dehydrogenase family)
MSDALSGKVAVITGASRGIGAEIVSLFLARDARVVAVSRSVEEYPEHTALATVSGDVRDPETARRAVACAREHFGGLDVLVNNAGLDHTGPVDSAPVEEVREVFDVNFFGALHMLQAAVPALRERGGGSIVNITSRLAQIGVPTMALYSASKGALLALTRGAAVELAPHGIRVNAVAPGMTQTPLLDAWLKGLPDPEAALGEVTAAIPQGRLATPRDVAEAVAFLSGDGAAYITGTSLAVDGGYTAT